jgi:hypothetical protein
MATSEVVKLKRELVVSNVLARIALGDNITQACENSGLAVSTWYLWRKQGVIDPFIQQIREELEVTLAGQVGDKWTSVVELLLDDASDEDAEVRDRDKSRRTLLQTLKAMNLLPSESDAAERGPSAREWLERRRGEAAFVPVTVLVQGDIVGVKQQATTDDDMDVVDAEIEERQPGDYSPIQVNFPITAEA